MCDRLLALGVPLHRFTASVRTLHPMFGGRAFYWKPDTHVEIRTATHNLFSTPVFTRSVHAAVLQAGQAVRFALQGPSARRDLTPLDELADQGFVDYLSAPLLFLHGEGHVVSFATKSAGGFSDEHAQQLVRMLRPLARIAEILAQRREAVNLLNTYVGHNAGERILAGKIIRGDIETIRSVIWFSDLRGFTNIASQIPPQELISILNGVFECQVPAIQAHGGEVLKFIGDGLLAIFPIAKGTATTAQACDAALASAEAAVLALDALNGRRAQAGDAMVRLGIALNVGDVAYGNIGSDDRLDFTCIGTAVNLAARLEGLTSKLHRPLVVGADVALAASMMFTPLGEFTLKGIPTPQAVFAPASGPLASF
jgi:adenylate cyclase